MDYTEILKEIYEEIQPYAQMGKPASYIPELLKVNPDRYGICLRTIEGKEYAQGDSDERFAVQSISKVFSLAMSFGRIGNELWKRIGVEPSGIQLHLSAGNGERNPPQSTHQCRGIGNGRRLTLST